MVKSNSSIGLLKPGQTNKTSLNTSRINKVPQSSNFGTTEETSFRKSGVANKPQAKNFIQENKRLCTTMN
jgi:hypothetical protein